MRIARAADAGSAGFAFQVVGPHLARAADADFVAGAAAAAMRTSPEPVTAVLGRGRELRHHQIAGA